MGSVGHWGYIHIRKNQYEANITVEPVDGTWKSQTGISVAYNETTIKIYDPGYYIGILFA